MFHFINDTKKLTVSQLIKKFHFKKTKIHLVCSQNLPPVLIVGDINPANTLICYVLKNHFNIILPSVATKTNQLNDLLNT